MTTEGWDWANAIVCRPHCWECGGPLPEGQDEGFCSQTCMLTIPIIRWSCTCGRFVKESDLCSRDLMDPGAYYGVSTETHYHCSRCGFQEGEARMTHLGSFVAKP